MRSPTRRREAVERIRREKPEVSERRACKTIGQARSSQRYAAKVKGDEKMIIAEIHRLVREHPRYGYRRVHACLKRSGWQINVKRVYRLWRQEGFKVPKKQRKKRRLGIGENGIMRRRAEGINDVWCWDFIHDRDERGRKLKWLMIEDEFTREGLVLEVDRSIKADDVLALLSELMLIRGVPAHIRSDNGPEFIARAIRDYLDKAGVQTLYVEPGSPWQNGYAESFGSKVRDELLNAEIFADLPEAKGLSAWWKNEYNHRRPH